MSVKVMPWLEVLILVLVWLLVYKEMKSMLLDST